MSLKKLETVQSDSDTSRSPGPQGRENRGSLLRVPAMALMRDQLTNDLFDDDVASPTVLLEPHRTLLIFLVKNIVRIRAIQKQTPNCSLPLKATAVTRHGR